MKKEKHLAFKNRTKQFALMIIRLYTSLPKTEEARVIGRQLLRSGTSVGAHYREAIRSRSDAEYISKIEVAMQELEEAMYWLELLIDAGICAAQSIDTILSESNELMSIFVACIKSAKSSQ